MSRLLLTTAAVLATLAAPSAARADYVLDSFTNPSPGTIYQIALLNSNPYTAPSTAVSATVTRDVTVTVIAPLPPNFNGVSGTIGGGAFSMDTDNATDARSDLTYTLTGASRNLTGATGLDLAFINVNPGNTSTGVATTMPVKIDLVTATGTLSLTTTVAGTAVPLAKTFNFASFTGTGNLSQVNSIKISLNGPAGNVAADFALDEIRVRAPVPAPPAVLLAGMGLVVLAGRSRLRRKATA